MKFTVDQFLRSSRSTPSLPSPGVPSAAGSSSSSSAPSSPSKVPSRPPLIRNGVVPPPTPPRLPSTPSTGRIRFAPEPVKERTASPRRGKVRAKALGAAKGKAKAQTEVAPGPLEIPSEHEEIRAFIVEFVRRHPSTKATVQRHLDFINLGRAYLASGRQSQDIKAALIAARVPVKVPTPRLSPYVSPKPAHDRLKRFVYTPSGLTKQVVLKPVKGTKAKTSAARARMLLDKKWSVRYSETSPRMLSPLEAQAVEIVKAYFRAAPRSSAPPAASAAAASSSSSTTCSSSVDASPRSASSSVVGRHAAGAVSQELREKDLPAIPESDPEPLPVGFNHAPHPATDEEPMCFYDSASSSGVTSNSVLATMAVELVATEDTLDPSPPPECPAIPPTLDPSEDGEVSVEHIENVAGPIVHDIVAPAPKSPAVATQDRSTDNSTPRTSLRSRAIARLITGTSDRMKAKASMSKSGLVGVGLGIIGIGLGLATTSMPSTSDLAMMSTAPPSSPDLPSAATFAQVPASMDVNTGTSARLSCITGLSRGGDTNLTVNSDTHVLSASPATASSVLHPRTPSSAVSSNRSLPTPIPPSADLDGVDEGIVVHPREPSTTGASKDLLDEHHSTGHGRGLASLLDSMARSLMGSWFKA